MCYSKDSLPDGAPEVFRIRSTVSAFRVTEPFEVKGRDGKTSMIRDGWICVGEDGQPYGVPDAIFSAAYERVG